nr:hypothetical protein [Tanacetum cinerariifolium]
KASPAIVEPLRIENPFFEDQFQEDPPKDPPEVSMTDNRTMAEMLRAPTEGQFQATPPLAPVKAVEETCVTCGGAHSYYQCLAAGGKTFPELRDNIQGYDRRRWDLDGILNEIRVRESLLYTFIYLRINRCGRSRNGRSINNKSTASGDGFAFTLRVSNGIARERSRP